MSTVAGPIVDRAEKYVPIIKSVPLGQTVHRAVVKVTYVLLAEIVCMTHLKQISTAEVFVNSPVELTKAVLLI